MRETRKQATDPQVGMYAPEAMGKPHKSAGEYLNDIEAIDELFTSLTQFVNSIGQFSNGTHLMFADFDYDGNKRLIGLRLETRTS